MEKQSLGSLIEKTMDKIEQNQDGIIMAGIPTGLTRLDQITSGLQQSNLITISGASGSGKTALAMSIAVKSSIEAKTNVHFVTLNETKSDLAFKMMCSVARVDINRIKSGFMSGDDCQKLNDAATTLSELPITIIDKFNLSELQDDYVDLLIIDSFQRIPYSIENLNFQDHRTYRIANQLKDFAIEEGVPVIVTSSMNEWQIDQRQDKHPRLSDAVYGYAALFDISDTVNNPFD